MKACYTAKQLVEAIERVLAGETLTAIAESSPVSLSTLKRRVAARKEGCVVERQRPGPAPTLPAACEADIVTWIAAMQRRLVPVQPWEVLQAANNVHHMIRGNLRSVKDLTSGWYNRFTDRHPELSLRASEPLARARNEADSSGLGKLFYELTKLVIIHNLDGSRIWNMDETSYLTKHQSSTVLAVRGSSNVWTKSTESAFHLSVVAAVSADGHAAPPLYILPDKTVRRTALDGCHIPKSGIHTAAKGFLNAVIFDRWIKKISDGIGADIARPIVLVCDGCTSHMGASAVSEARTYGIILVFLPANATHLVQPLDVAVFKGFKHEVRKLLRRELKASADVTISKKEAVAIASRAYKDKIRTNKKTIKNGFRTCGIFPLSLPNMEARLGKCNNGGIVRGELGLSSCLRVREEARQHILTLPPSPLGKKSSRKTADASQQILRKRDLLVTPPRKKRKTKSGLEAPQPIHAVEDDSAERVSAPGPWLLESALV